MKNKINLIIEKLNTEYKDRKLITKIANMCEYYCDWQRNNDLVTEKKLKNLLFNIIYSFVDGQENIKPLLMTNPLLVNKFCWWNRFLQENFAEKIFFQEFEKAVDELVNSSVILESEFPAEFYLDIFYALHNEKNIRYYIQKLKPECASFEKNIFFLSKGEIKDFIRCLAIVKNYNADSVIVGLINSFLFENKIEPLISLALMFNVKVPISNEYKFEHLSVSGMFGYLLIKEKNERI